MRDRLLVLGLDAADRDLVRGWAEDGDLPCLAKLLESGVTIPVSTPPAVLEGAVWPTLITGSSPASHGMFATLKIKPGTYEVEEAMRADRLPTPPFWAQLSRAGKRVAVIDAPFARPVRGLNGIQVTNWGAHDAWAWPRSSWPARLVRDLVRRFGPHPVPRCDSPGRSLHDYESLRDCLISGVEKKTALLRHCLALEDWDLFFGIFSESHCAGHQLWHLMDSEHPRHAPEAPHSLRDALRAVYRALDAGLAALLDAVPPGTHILLLLSHGMGPWYDGSHLLDALLDRLTQQLVRGAPRSGPTWSPHPARGLLWRGRACLPPLVRQKVRELFPGPVARLWTWTHPAPTFPWHTKSAFAMPSYNMTGGIRINLKGREPAGLVEPGRQYETLCSTLIDALLAVENAESGRPAVQWVARADHLYQGPHLAEMPDLFVEWDHSWPIRSLRSPLVGTLARSVQGDRTGEHRPGGLLVGLGPRFDPTHTGAEIRTQDIAPTILAFFRVPSPPSNQGQPAVFLRSR